jgi:uncharacterized short protein YbdD (DUF466 family)
MKQTPTQPDTSMQRYGQYVELYTEACPDQEPMAYEHWVRAKIRQHNETVDPQNWD